MSELRDKVRHLHPLPGGKDQGQGVEQRLAHLEKNVLETLESFESRLHRALEKTSQPREGEIGDALRALEERIRAELRALRSSRHGDLAEDINGLLTRLQHQMSSDTYRARLRAFRLRYRAVEVDEYGFDPIFAEQIAPLVSFFFDKYFRVSVEGIQHVPKDGRALLVANHSGTLPWDGLMLTHAVKSHHPQRRDVRALAEDFVFHFPYLGVIINRLGHVRACQENAERMLGEDRVVAVFPEGIKGIGKLYSQRYQLQRFGRGGFIRLALRTGAPIIPVAIIGAEEIHPMIARMTWLVRDLGIPYLPITATFPWLGPLGLVPLPSKWTIVFGPPLDLTRHGPDAANDRILINRLSEQVRQTIQQMVREVLKKRRSIWFG